MVHFLIGGGASLLEKHSPSLMPQLLKNQEQPSVVTQLRSFICDAQDTDVSGMVLVSAPLEDPDVSEPLEDPDVSSSSSAEPPLFSVQAVRTQAAKSKSAAND